MVILNLEDAAKYMENQGICTYQEGLAYLEAEDNYYENAGVLFDSEEWLSDSTVSNQCIDSDELDRFISNKTGIAIERVRVMSEKYLDYMIELGIAEIL